MLGSPLDLAWSNILDSIYLRKASDWNAERRLREVRTLVNATKGVLDTDVQEALDTILQDDYSRDLGGLNALRKALQEHHVDENGQLQTIDDPTDADSPDSVWESNPYISEAVHHAFNTHTEDVYNQASIRKDMDAAMAARYVSNIPDFRLRRNKVNKMMNLASEGRAWGARTPTADQVEDEVRALQEMLDSGEVLPDDIAELPQLGPGHIRRVARERVRARNSLDNPYDKRGLGSTFADPKEMTYTEIRRRLREFQEVLAYSYAEDKARKVAEYQPGGTIPESMLARHSPVGKTYRNSEDWRKDFQSRIVKSRNFKDQFARRHKRLRADYRDLPEGSQYSKTPAEIEEMAREDTLDKMWRDTLHNAFMERGRVRSTLHPLFHSVKEQLEHEGVELDTMDDDNVVTENQIDKIQAHKQAQESVLRMLHMIQVSTGTKENYGAQDWEKEYHDTNMRQIKNVWDDMSSDAQKILLGWSTARGPLLGGLLKQGVRGAPGRHTKPLPKDAIEQFAAHIHSTSAQQKERGDIPATHQDDSRRNIADYLEAIDWDKVDSEREREARMLPIEAEEDEEFDPKTGEKRSKQGTLRNVPVTDLGWKNSEYQTPEGGERPTLDMLISKATAQGKHEDGLPLAKKYLIDTLHQIFNPSDEDNNNILSRSTLSFDPSMWLEGRVAPGMRANQALSALIYQGTMNDDPNMYREQKRMKRLRGLLLDRNGVPKPHEEIVKDKDFGNIYNEDTYTQLRRVGQGRKEKEQFLSTLSGQKTEELKACPECNEHGHIPGYPGESCLNTGEQPGQCYGAFPAKGQEHLAGYIRPMSPARRLNSSSIKFINSLFGELLGTIEKDGKREPHMDWSQGHLDVPGYQMGLLAKTARSDREAAHRMNMTRVCPKCKGSGDVPIEGTDMSVTCSMCRHAGKRVDGLMRIPDMAAFYVSRGFGSPAGMRSETRRVQETHKLKLKIRDRLYGRGTSPVTQEQEAAQRSLERGMIPADGTTTPFEIHPLTRWPDFHTEKGALSEEGLGEARAAAVSALNETPLDRMEDRKDFIKEYLTNHYKEIFGRIANSMDPISAEIIEKANPEAVTDSKFFQELLELMSADLPYNTTNPLQLSSRSMNKVLSHMSHAHAPDFDGRNMHVDSGMMEEGPCSTCGGSGHMLNGRGEPIISHFCPECLGTKSEGVHKMLKRQPWIQQAYSREQLMDMFRKGKLDQELGRTPSYHNNKHLDSAGCQCHTCENGKAGVYHTAVGAPSLFSSGSMSDKFRATMFAKNPVPRQLPVSIDPSSVTSNDAMYDEILGALRRFRNIGDNPNQPFGTLEEGATTVDLEDEQIEREIEKIYSMLSGKEAKDALMAFHQEENIVPRFGDTWNSAPYLVDEKSKPEDFSQENIENMPCPYCNRLSNLGLFKGEIKTIGEHIKEGGVGDIAFTTCPEAAKRGDEEDGNLSKMMMDIKNNYFVNNKPKDETQLKWDRAYETLAPTLQEMTSKYKGSRGALDAHAVQYAISPGVSLRVPTIAPVAPIMIAQRRAATATGHNRRNDPNRRGRGRFSGMTWGVNTPTSQDNPYAMIRMAKEALPTNDNHKGKIMRLWALHILDPNYMVEQHGNPLEYLPLDIGDAGEIKKVNEEQEKLREWARGVLGKKKNEMLDNSERLELDHGWGKLQPLLHLERMWKHDVATAERKEVWDKADLGLPSSMFNFDKPTTFMHDDDTFDGMLSLVKTWAHDRLASATEGGYNADDAGYKQPFENHPSMEWFYKNSHKHVNSRLLTAWKEHDDETLKEFGDEWVVTGKSLPEIEASGIMDKLWEGVTNGMPVTTTKDGQRRNVQGWPTLEDVKGMDHGHEIAIAKWYKLRKEMMLRADNRNLSKQRMDDEGKEYAQLGANDLGTGTRCMVCLGNRTHMPGMNDAQFWWSAANPHVEGDVESYVPHVSDSEGGRRALEMVGIEGMEGHTPRWTHPDSIKWIHDHMTTAHGHDGEEGWRDFFEEQKNHGIIPSDWDVVDSDGVYTDNYINWLVSQEPECVACGGTSHCHDCGGAGYSPVPFSEEAMAAQRNIHLLKRVIEHRGTGAVLGDDGVFYANMMTPMWRKPTAQILADWQMGMPVGDRLQHLVTHTPQGQTLFTHEGLWTTDENGEQKVVGSKEEYDSKMEYDSRQFILNRILEGQNAYKKHLEERAKQVYPDGPLPETWAWPSPEKPYTGRDAKLREWLENENTTDDDKKKLFDLMTKYSNTGAEFEGRETRDGQDFVGRLDRRDLGLGKYVPGYSNLSIKQLQEKAKQLFSGKDFLVSPGETVSGDTFLKPIMNPQAEVMGFNDWKLGELIEHDELKLKNYSLPGLIEKYEERTGHVLDPNGRFSQEDILRLIYADKEYRDFGNETWPSWWTPQHNEAMHKDKFVHGKNAFADESDVPRRCQHPSCGVGTEDGEPKLATYSPNNIGGKYNSYGYFCDDHHQEEMHMMHNKTQNLLGGRKVFGGQRMLEEILRSTNLDTEELEEAFRGEEMDPDRSTFQGVSQMARLGLMFLGFHKIKGTNGNSDHFMPFFEGPNGRIGTAADFGLGHETFREGRQGIRGESLTEAEFWQPKAHHNDAENRGKSFFDGHGWDYHRTANSLPLIRLSKINEEITSQTEQDEYRNQWKTPSQKSVCPVCLTLAPNMVEDNNSDEARRFFDEQGRFPRIRPNCPNCDHEYGHFEENKKGKLRYVNQTPRADHVPMRGLLFNSNHVGEIIPTEHQEERMARERLVERMEAVQRGEKDPYIEGQDEALSRWYKFSGNALQLKTGDSRPETATNVNPKAIIDALQQLLVKRDDTGAVETDKSGSPKYTAAHRNLIEKAKTILNPKYRLPVLHSGFGSRMGHQSNPMKDAFRGIHTVSAANKVVKEINEVLQNTRSNTQKRSSRIDNAYMRLSKGKIVNDREVGNIREIGNSGLTQYVLSSKARTVLRAAKKIIQRSDIPPEFAMGDDKATRDLRDAHLIVSTEESLDRIKRDADRHRDIGRLMLYSDTRSNFIEDPSLSAITTSDSDYARGFLTAANTGIRATPIPMHDDVDDDTRKEYEFNGQLTHGIRPQSYHDIMGQHEDIAREEFDNWSRDYFYHGAANKAVRTGDENVVNSFNSVVPVPVQNAPGSANAAVKSLGSYLEGEDVDPAAPLVEDS